MNNNIHSVIVQKNAPRRRKATAMYSSEKVISRFGSPKSIAEQIEKYAPAAWMYCERHANIVATWLCDSFFSSYNVFGDWAYLAGQPVRRDIELAVEAMVVAARIARGSKRRQWARDVATEYGTDEQAERAKKVDPPRHEVEALVFGFLGVGALPVGEILCKECLSHMARSVELAADSRFDAIADRVIEIIDSQAVGFRISSEQVLATYRCEEHGIVTRFELEVHVEHAETGWCGRRRFDLAGCHCSLADLDSSDLE